MERQLLLTAIQITTLFVVVFSGLALYRAETVWRSLRGKSGGQLAIIVVGVLLAFFISQILTAINVFNLLSSESTSNYHVLTRLIAQLVITTAAIWATIRLARIH